MQQLVITSCLLLVYHFSESILVSCILIETKPHDCYLNKVYRIVKIQQSALSLIPTLKYQCRTSLLSKQTSLFIHPSSESLPLGIYHSSESLSLVIYPSSESLPLGIYHFSESLSLVICFHYLFITLRSHFH